METAIVIRTILDASQSHVQNKNIIKLRININTNMKTKAQSLSINTMIISALALLALVVLIFILTKGSTFFSTTVLTCESKGGSCVVDKECRFEKTAFNCDKKGEICCINPLTLRG